MYCRFLATIVLLLGAAACASQSPEDAVSDQTAENIALTHYQLEQMDAGNLDVFDELCAEDYRYYAAGVAEPLDCEEHKEAARQFYSAFSNFGHTVEDILAVDDKVVVRLTDFGTHTGEFAGLAPTGNDVRFRVTTISRFEEGKIAETWIDADFLTLFQQLGNVPPALLRQ